MGWPRSKHLNLTVPTSALSADSLHALDHFVPAESQGNLEHALLDLFTPEELRNALSYIDVFERWNMPCGEADEWRRRIGGRREFSEFGGTTSRLD